MSSNSINLYNFSLLRQVFIASDEQADRLLGQLPNELTGRIQAILHGSSAAPNRQQGINLAIKEIALGFLESQTIENYTNISRIFYEVCNDSDAVDYEWVKQHISEDDKINQLLQSVEIGEIKNILDAWV